nr:MAG TPA: hypothetical protein [Crassvirales sp.]
MKTNCSNCEVRKYCGTMVASISLCRVTNTNKKK